MKYMHISWVTIIKNTLYPINLLYINYIFLIIINLDHPLYLKVCSFCRVNIFIK